MREKIISQMAKDFGSYSRRGETSISKYVGFYRNKEGGAKDQ